MQASINAIRHKSSSLAWSIIRFNKINVDYSYLKVDSTNRRCISNKEKPLPDTQEQRFIRSNKTNFDSSYPKVDCVNRYCVSSKEMHALPDNLQQNKPPLVKSSGIFNFHKELREKYPKPPDAELALLDAVRTENSSLVRSLIKFNEIDINYVFPPMANSVLHLAAYLGSMDIVKILVEEGHASFRKNMFDFWPIHFAAQNNHMDLVQYFSDRSPELKALLEAVQQKNASLVRSLIKSNKVDVNYVYPEGEYTILHVAASVGSLDIVKILVEEGHAVSISNRIEEYPIHEAAQNDHVDVVQYLEGKDPYGLHTGKDYSYLDMLISD